MLANLKISGPPCDKALEGTAPPESNFALTTGIRLGRRMTRVSAPNPTKETNPIVMPSYPLGGLI